jgi:DNA modification methylase
VSNYRQFLEAKSIVVAPSGLIEIPELNPALFGFQRDIVTWALKRGKSAIFADCGLGKTLMQLEWARHIPGRILILTPLAVAPQTVREGQKFGINVKYAHTMADAGEHITVTNYEKLQHFDPSQFNGIVLDESSILKSYDGKTRTAIIDAFKETPYRLACTATPAPNDYMELGNHSEFLGIMSRTEMLSMFFVHDGGETQKWRLKGHAESEYWKWIASWAVLFRKPSDLGYSDAGFDLPELTFHEHVVKTEQRLDGELFAKEAQTLQERIRARKDTIQERAELCASIVGESPKPWMIWCNLNDESAAAVKLIDGAVEVKGSDNEAFKEKTLAGFSEQAPRILVSKPSIAGFGMNWQHCADIAFIGLSDSYEQFYQAIRRCWRFGQTKQVNVHVIVADTEGAVLANIKRKEADAERMALNMVEHMKDLNKAEIQGAARTESPYIRDKATGNGWELHLADCVDVATEQADESIDFSVFSPPFASLYTYSNSDRDMGNSKDGAEFAKHFRFLVDQLFRITRSGRLVSFHCMNLPTSKVRDGIIGIRDFRGELIRMFEECGFVFHSEVCIWKDPVTAMQRTKALGLLHKQLKKDSAMSRQGIPDYLVTMRKPGENSKPISHTAEGFPVQVWQEFASPVWMDINPSDTLQYRSARAEKDERHICPLQLEVIRRAMRLWSREGDLVFSPFAGIGSEGYIALQMGRKFLGAELKPSYFEQCKKNLEHARIDMGELDLTFNEEVA